MITQTHSLYVSNSWANNEKPLYLFEHASIVFYDDNWQQQHKLTLNSFTIDQCNGRILVRLNVGDLSPIHCFLNTFELCAKFFHSLSLSLLEKHHTFMPYRCRKCVNGNRFFNKSHCHPTLCRREHRQVTAFIDPSIWHEHWWN